MVRVCDLYRGEFSNLNTAVMVWVSTDYARVSMSARQSDNRSILHQGLPARNSAHLVECNLNLMVLFLDSQA